MEKGFFSTPELAELLGVFHTTVRRWIEQDQIRGFRVGRNYKIPSAEVIRMLDEHGLPLPEILKDHGPKPMKSTEGIREAVDSGSILQRLLVVDQIDDPSLICRRDVILATNQAFADLLGSTQADLMGMQIGDLLGESGFAAVRTAVCRCFEATDAGPVECTVYLNGQGKAKKETSISVSPLGGMKEVFLMVVKVL